MRSILRHAAWLMGLCAVPAIAPAQAQMPSANLTPARFFACQVAAREATLVGMDERAALLNRQASAAEQSAAGERSRQRVEMALNGCGYSAVRLAAYGHREAATLQEWLARSPDTQARLNQLQQRLVQASARMQASPSKAQ